MNNKLQRPLERYVIRQIINWSISNEKCSFEREPLEKMSLDKKLFAYKHKGFWTAMDSLKDKNVLDSVLNSGEKFFRDLQRK